MTTISRVDQAMLLLKERIGRLKGRMAETAAPSTAAARGRQNDPLVPLRQLVRSGTITEGEFRRALVRTLLADSLGEELVASLEFQSIAEHVTTMLEDSEAGRSLLTRAFAELE